jgi:hypothetical protein
MKKKFIETRVGKFLKSKGLNAVLDLAGDVVPGVAVLDKVKDALIGKNSQYQVSPEDRDIFIELYKLDVSELDLVLKDKANARERELSLFKAGKKSDWLMSATGVVGLIMFMFIAYVMVFVEIPENNKALFNQFIGIIEGVIISIFTYYWGSSRGSKQKTEILKKFNG